MNCRNGENIDRDQFRANLLKFTRKAYLMLPRLDKPRILDIGCGSGVVTLELARISGGNIVAVDVDGNALDRLVARAMEKDLSGRVMVVHTSMLKMRFPPNSFDIIWTEGAISYIGFQRGLSEWRDLVVSGGYLVVHDVLSDLQKKIESTRTCGYTIIGRLELTSETWWNEYYVPLKRRLEALQEMGLRDRRVIEDMRTAEREIEEFDFGSDRFASIFLVLKKT